MTSSLNETQIEPLSAPLPVTVGLVVSPPFVPPDDGVGVGVGAV